MDIQLLGGIAVDGQLHKLAHFNQLNGKLEQVIVELEHQSDRVNYVTDVLYLALERIGSLEVEREIIEELCVADRQLLMINLARMMFGNNVWLEVVCKYCKDLFDLNINRSELPIYGAGATYPYIQVKLGKNYIRGRVPNGSDQDAIQNLPDEQAIRTLLLRCIDTVNEEKVETDFIGSLTEKDYELIDKAFEDTSPSVCDSILVICPECNKEQSIRLDHYDMGQINENGFYDELHVIASHYHWSEDNILQLSREKRRRYVNMINRESGIYE